MNTNILTRLFRIGDHAFSRRRDGGATAAPFAHPDEPQKIKPRFDDVTCWFAMMDRGDALDPPCEDGDACAEPSR